MHAPGDYPPAGDAPADAADVDAPDAAGVRVMVLNAAQPKAVIPGWALYPDPTGA